MKEKDIGRIVKFQKDVIEKVNANIRKKEFSFIRLQNITHVAYDEVKEVIIVYGDDGDVICTVTSYEDFVAEYILQEVVHTFRSGQNSIRDAFKQILNISLWKNKSSFNFIKDVII